MRWTKIGEIIKAYDNFAKRTISKDGLKKNFVAQKMTVFFRMEKNHGGRQRKIPGVYCFTPEIVTRYFGE